MFKLLIVDDDRTVRRIVRAGLEELEGCTIIEAADGDAALKLLQAERPDVALLDIYLPEHHGLELFQKFRAIDRKLPVIFITADATSETVIQAMRAGAYDYLSKPLRIDQLRRMVASAARARQAMEQPVAMSIGISDSQGDCFIGKSPAMVEVFKSIGRVAAQSIAVLIRGESGAGKELVARALVDHGDRADKPFVAVNCAAIPDQLLESELFGHEKGSFTGAESRRIGRFEQCDGGTIFLDEIGDMSPVIQGKVLRVLQEQRFERVGGNATVTTNVRVIAATNRPLEEMVERGEFREDLLYRLNGFTIHLPPLRERREDIPALLEYFLARAKADMQRADLSGISNDAFSRLMEYDWPGNVRQLQSVMRQALLNTTGTVLTLDSLPEFLQQLSEPPPAAQPQIPSHNGYDAAPHTATKSHSLSEQPESIADDDAFLLGDFIDQQMQRQSTNLYAEVIEEVERRLLTHVLGATGGNQSRASEILGITRGKIRDRIASYGIQLDCTVSIDSQD
jgi:two-component system nitrogen regulation response regulator GlnG